MSRCSTILIEQRLTHPYLWEMGGIPDVVCIDGSRVTLFDFKFGNRWVDVIDNFQLKAYLLLVYRNYPGLTEFTAVIVQPNAGEPLVRGHDYTVRELEATEERIKFIRDNPELLLAGDHCTYCPCLLMCPRFKWEVSRLLDRRELTDDDRALVARWLHLKKPIKKALERAEELGKRWANQGEDVPGFTTLADLGNREWATHDDAFLANELINRGVPEDVLFDKDGYIRSPAQVEKHGYGDQIKNLVHRPVKGKKLVPVKRRSIESVIREFEGCYDD